MSLFSRLLTALGFGLDKFGNMGRPDARPGYAHMDWRSIEKARRRNRRTKARREK
jgi:hypothetical protein